MAITTIPIASTSPILSLSYNSKFDMLAVGQMGDDTLKPCLSLWHASDRKEMEVIVESKEQNILSTCFDYRGQVLLYADYSKLYRYDMLSKETIEFDIDNNRIIKIISSKTSPRVIVAGKYVQVLDVDTGKILWTLNQYEASRQTTGFNIEGLPNEWHLSKDKNGFINETAVIEIFEDGKSVLIGGHNKGAIEQIEIASGRVVRTIFPAPVQAYIMSLGCFESVLAVSSKIPYANFLWELNSGKRILPEIFNERFGGYSSLCLHSKEKLLLSSSFVGYVSLQNLDDGQFIFSEQLHKGRVPQIVFSDDPNLFYSGGDDGKVLMIKLE